MLRVIRGGGVPSTGLNDAEDALVRALYAKRGPERVASILGRDPAQVAAYARFWGHDGGRGVTVYDGGTHG